MYVFDKNHFSTKLIGTKIHHDDAIAVDCNIFYFIFVLLFLLFHILYPAKNVRPEAI